MLQPDSIAEHHERAILLHDFLVKESPKGTYKSTRRNTLFMALCDMTHEHHGAIIVLTKSNQHWGSALALLRPLIETCIRAFWIMYCADDVLIEKIVKQTETFPTLQKCSEAVNLHFETEGYPGLFSVSKDYRNQLHGLTHSGIEQLQYRFDDRLRVKPTYPNRTICQLLKSASMWLSMSVIAQLLLIEGSQSESTERFSRKYIELFSGT